MEKITKILIGLFIIGVIAFGIYQISRDVQIKDTTISSEEEVLNTIERMTEAFQNSDIEGVMSTYEDGAIVMFEPETPISDSSLLRESFKNSFTLNPQFTFAEHEVYIAGDIAMHITPWKMVGKTPDGQDIEQGGLSVAVLRRQSDGKWLMVIDNPHGSRLLDK